MSPVSQSFPLQDLNMNSTLTTSTSLDLSVKTTLVISTIVVSFLLGLPLNIYIIILLFPRRGVMEASDVFSWNQAVSEIFYVLSGPFHILCRLSYSLCIIEAFGFLRGTSLSSRCLFQSCVCLERYLAVVHPVTFLRYKPLRYRAACSIAVWMCSLAIGVTYTCMLRNFPYRVFAVIYVIILIIDGFFCVSILRKPRDPGPRDMERDAGEMDAAKKKAFQVVSVNLVAFLLQNVPVSVSYGFKNVLPEDVLDVLSDFGILSNVVTGLFQSVYTLYRAGAVQGGVHCDSVRFALEDLNMNSTLTNSTSLAFSVSIILSISLNAVNLLLGLPLNVYIIVRLFPGRGAMEASDVFSWNKAISEIFFVLYGPFQIWCSLDWDSCFIPSFGFLLGTSLSSRCLFQSCVCLEWYLAVVHPVTFLRYKPLRYRAACSIAVWMCSLGIGVAYSCVFDNWPYAVFAVVYVIVLMVDGFCCVSILSKLRDAGPRDMERDAGEMDAVKKKAFQVVSVNLLTFLLQNVPVSVALGLPDLSNYAFGVVLMTSLASCQQRRRGIIVLGNLESQTAVCSLVRSVVTSGRVEETWLLLAGLDAPRDRLGTTLPPAPRSFLAYAKGTYGRLGELFAVAARDVTAVTVSMGANTSA
ncbi:hypothetical protein NFI96_000422 [Prochilodus magdalenae]|nr:hypothetical protein NFI96_000422 [Prochilodus magdalenae]